MISTTGRMPVMDMPRATPMKPFSQMGVASTRPGNLLGQADVGLEHAAIGVDVLAHEDDRRDRSAIASSRAALTASR